MKKIILLVLFASALFADNHERRVTFDVMKNYQTNVSCRVVGSAPYVILVPDVQNSGNKKQKTVTREYSILTKKGGCPETNGAIMASKYTCYITKVTREIEAPVSRLEGEGYCRNAIAPDPELLKAFCEMVPSDEKCR